MIGHHGEGLLLRLGCVAAGRGGVFSPIRSDVDHTDLVVVGHYHILTLLCELDRADTAVGRDFNFRKKLHLTGVPEIYKTVVTGARKNRRTVLL